MSNPNNSSDFVQVRLTPAGRAFAGEAQTLRAANAHAGYTFTGDTPQKVLYRGEWALFLSRELTPKGDALFELVGDAPAATTTVTPEA